MPESWIDFLAAIYYILVAFLVVMSEIEDREDEEL